MRKETAYATLKRVAEIEDVDQRKQALRNEVSINNLLAIAVQRCYHPNYNFNLPNLPKGPLPPEIAKKSGHDQYGIFYRTMRRWDAFRVPTEVPINSAYKPKVIEAQFIDLYESVAEDDALLLVAIKDKELPWETLNCEFVVDTLPELFPSSFRRSVENEVSTAADETTDNEPSTETGKTLREICGEIIRENPSITRKEYLQKLRSIVPDASTVSATAYLYQIKKAVS